MSLPHVAVLVEHCTDHGAEVRDDALCTRDEEHLDSMSDGTACCMEYMGPEARLCNLTHSCPYTWVLSHPIRCLYISTEYMRPSA